MEDVTRKGHKSAEDLGNSFNLTWKIHAWRKDISYRTYIIATHSPWNFSSAENLAKTGGGGCKHIAVSLRRSYSQGGTPLWTILTLYIRL